MPNDPQKTVVTAYVALAIKGDVLDRKAEYARVPVLKNLLPCAGADGQVELQHRQLDQRRAAGLRPQPHRRFAAALGKR